MPIYYTNRKDQRDHTHLFNFTKFANWISYILTFSFRIFMDLAEYANYI